LAEPGLGRRSTEGPGIWGEAQSALLPADSRGNDSIGERRRPRR